MLAVLASARALNQRPAWEKIAIGSMAKLTITSWPGTSSSLIAASPDMHWRVSPKSG